MHYPAPVSDVAVLYGIGGLAVLMAFACAMTYGPVLLNSRIKLLLRAGAWLALTGFVASSGLLSRADVMPPPMVVMILVVVGGSAFVGLSRITHSVVQDVPLVTLIGLQMFRLPLEMVMHHAAQAGIMPTELSFAGYNFDVITGIGAVAIYLLMKGGVHVGKGLVWVWNIWGLYSLLAILAIAVATAPFVHAFGTIPQHINTWVLHFPYVWLPTVLVPIAITGHLMVTRKLLSKTA
jgi:hypothetical protein